MTDTKTEIYSNDGAGIAQAARVLRQGGLVAFPTETVYGLGADARDSDAVARIYAAKGRPSFNPLIVHVGSLDAAKMLVDFDAGSAALAAAFWPGALTLVLPLRADANVSPLVTAGLDTLAVRVPSHPTALRLLEETELPLAAPSANPSGFLSPTQARHVTDGLAGRIDGVLDGGDCAVGLESTIVQVQDRVAHILRPGGITQQQISAILETNFDPIVEDQAPSAPGQMLSHYAPRGTLRMDATDPNVGEVHIGFGSIKGDVTLSRTGNLTEAAARLFDVLHAMDARGVMRIAVAPIPEQGVGLAINDRLRRAAAPRGS